jgi:hypothetical protein
MARTASEQAAINRSNALVSTEVEPGGPVTYRVAVAHTDDSHPSSATFHYGPAISDQFADIVAHVRGVAPGEVDLLAEARELADRARQEYPESDGWAVSVEAIVPHPDESDRHVVRLVEED